jgi:capsular exopolysaccharide synthesis family protein
MREERLAAILVSRGLVDEATLARVREHQAARGIALEDALTDLDLVSPADLDTARAQADDAALEAGSRDVRRVSSEIVMLTEHNGMRAEAIRALRTRIVAQHVREGRRALVLCAPHAESGCTFVAANLAVALAQIGAKTLLVDADLRTPRIGEMFELDGSQPGLSDYLADNSLRLDEVLYPDILPLLSVVPAGRAAANPQELLSSSRFKYFVDILMREYDVTIFDTTPANICADAQRVSTVAGYSLIVSRQHNTYVGDVSTLAKQLVADRAVVIGSVLNEF